MVDQTFFYVRIGREYAVCSQWRKHALQELQSIKPDVVIFGSTFTYDFTRTQWINGTANVLNHVTAAVGHVYLLRATPQLPFDGPACLLRQRWLSGSFDLHRRCAATPEDPRSAAVYQWLNAAARRFPNVVTIDMNPLICPDHRCEAERNGVVVFRDRQHLTASFVRTLANSFADRVRPGA